MAKGVRRERCPLNPLLFNILISDIEEEMRKIKWKRMKIKEKRIYTLMYADDMVMLAKGEDEMRSIIGRLEGYLDGKKLEVNIEKTKIMRFRKRGGRMRKIDCRWKEKKIEEVKEYKYLGYVVQRNEGQEAQVEDRVKRAAAIMRQVWRIDKRRFREDWGRRIWLFNRLVWIVMSYGMEI